MMRSHRPVPHASSILRAAVGRGFCERLEARNLLHGGTDGLDPELVAHVRSEVLANNDVLEYIGTDYDPHKIGVPTDDDRLGGARSPRDGVEALPDMFPWLGPNGNNYFRDTSIDRFSIPGRSLLRFSTAIANGGAGPVELRAGPITDDGAQTVYQRVYNYDSDTNQFTFREDREAGEFIYHPGHNHFHFEGYAEYRLLQNVDGQVGELAQRDDGSPVLGEKVGFCLINITTFDSTLPGYSSSPGSYGCGARQGISVGRADVYHDSLDSQWIDITGVPAGDYFIEVTLDANNAVMESDETNNTIQVPVSISNTGSTVNGTQPDRFDVVASNNTFATASDLGSLDDVVEASLTLHQTYDLDYYKFTAASSGPIRIQLSHTGGDANLFLYDKNYDEVGRSTRPSGTETINATLVGGHTYYIKAENFQYLDDIVDNYALVIDGPVPAVSTTSDRRVFAEGETFSVFLSRTGRITEPLIADLTFGGTATYGTDYTVNTDVASFGAEADTFEVIVTAIKDNFREGRESIEISIGASADAVPGSVKPVWITDYVMKRPGGSTGGDTPNDFDFNPLGGTPGGNFGGNFGRSDPPSILLPVGDAFSEELLFELEDGELLETRIGTRR